MSKVRSATPSWTSMPKLVVLSRAGVVDPQTVLTQLEGVRTAVEAHDAFDDRRPGG